MRFDPSYEGTGLSAGSKLDEIIWDEFHNDRNRLKVIAKKIKSILDKPELKDKLYQLPEEEDFENIEVSEGKVVYRLHKLRERNSSLINKKKSQYFKKHGKLDCEICGFDFYEKYGEIGKGFIECHHKKPLHELEEETKVTIKDLALVCANCHRILHRDIETLTVEKLKNNIK